MSIYLGFDPGGAGHFGWCVARESGSRTLPLIVLGIDVADHARDAVEAAIGHVPAGEPVLAAGIDAPLIWSRIEGRKVEGELRCQIRRADSKTAEGTVQHVNSLRGACVVQGMMTAVFLREAFAGLPLSEAHPKACPATGCRNHTRHDGAQRPRSARSAGAFTTSGKRSASKGQPEAGPTPPWRRGPVHRERRSATSSIAE
jgi:hypothetical protein